MATEAPAFAFVFVCHGGELEIKSLLLAASLREAFGDAPQLIAAVPQYRLRDIDYGSSFFARGPERGVIDISVAAPA